MTEHEFFTEIAGRIAGAPDIDDDRGVATTRVQVTQTIRTSRGPMSTSMRLCVWTNEERWREELRLYRSGEPINVFCKQMRPGQGSLVDTSGRRWPGRERFVIDYLEPGEDDLSDRFRVEMTGRLASDPYLGTNKYGRFGRLELIINQRGGRDDSRGPAVAHLFHASVLGEKHAYWLRDNLRRDDELTLFSTALTPGRARPSRSLERPDEYIVDPPVFNIAARPALLQPERAEPGTETRDADAVREASVLAGRTMQDHRRKPTGSGHGS